MYVRQNTRQCKLEAEKTTAQTRK